MHMSIRKRLPGKQPNFLNEWRVNLKRGSKVKHMIQFCVCAQRGCLPWKPNFTVYSSHQICKIHSLVLKTEVCYHYWKVSTIKGKIKIFSFHPTKVKRKTIKYWILFLNLGAVSHGFFPPQPEDLPEVTVWIFGNKRWTGALLTPYLVGKEEEKGTDNHYLESIAKLVSFIKIPLQLMLCRVYRVCGKCTADHTMITRLHLFKHHQKLANNSNCS